MHIDAFHKLLQVTKGLLIPQPFLINDVLGLELMGVFWPPIYKADIMNSPQIRDPTSGTGKCVLHFP